ncbi:HNH endonuclease signature motif containing protein [Agrococcus casei]|uniref:HNH nuclease domain-containing protein n=2 Tax=Agrococcus TaxID=46352 RepID=A0A1R4EWE4_9MICO|nr:HNH endonuclease signature motif containing protein [Agrococcus casei]SJM47983.1 hypothetical protein CZ674_01340 [Agrococcus casei LMG 22410]
MQNDANSAEDRDESEGQRDEPNRGDEHRDATSQPADSQPVVPTPALAQLATPQSLTEADIVDEGSGRFTVGDCCFDSFDDARAFIDARRALDQELSNVVAFEQLVERQEAMLTRMRSNAALLTAEVARLQSGGLSMNHETEEQLVTSTVASVLQKSEQTVCGRISEAALLAEQYPATLDAWSAGRIHRGHVRVIQRAGEALTERQRPWFEQEVLDVVGHRTPSQLARVSARIARRFQHRDPDEIAKEAFADRAVWIEEQRGGMAHLVIKTSGLLAEAALNRLTEAARSASADDVRRMPQRLSDTAMAALITGTCDAGLLEGVTAKVHVTMPATLVTGVAGAQQAETAGGALIDTATALRLAGGAPSWVRLFTDPASGVAVTADVYQPTASLRRLIVARDQTCRFVGCSRAAMHCDVDHTQAWEDGGRTVADNLEVLCRHHHTLKHRLGPNRGWRVQQLPNGTLEWTSPDGTVRRVEPEPVATAIIIESEQAHDPYPPDGPDPWNDPPLETELF